MARDKVKISREKSEIMFNKNELCVSAIIVLKYCNINRFLEKIIPPSEFPPYVFREYRIKNQNYKCALYIVKNGTL